MKIASHLSVVKGRLKNLAAKELFGASSVNYFTLWIENTADLNVSIEVLPIFRPVWDESKRWWEGCV